MDTPRIFLLLLISGIPLIALLVTVALLLPAPVKRAHEMLAASFWRSFLLGLVNFLFVAAIAALLARLGQRAGGVLAAVLLLLAILLAIALMIFSVIGLSGLTKLLGERIGTEGSTFRQHLHGSLLLVLAELTPYIGWFVLAPLALITGFGAALQAVFRKRPAEEKPV